MSPKRKERRTVNQIFSDEDLPEISDYVPESKESVSGEVIQEGSPELNQPIQDEDFDSSIDLSHLHKNV